MGWEIKRNCLWSLVEGQKFPWNFSCEMLYSLWLSLWRGFSPPPVLWFFKKGYSSHWFRNIGSCIILIPSSSVLSRLIGISSLYFRHVKYVLWYWALSPSHCLFLSLPFIKASWILKPSWCPSLLPFYTIKKGPLWLSIISLWALCFLECS